MIQRNSHFGILYNASKFFESSILVLLVLRNIKSAVPHKLIFQRNVLIISCQFISTFKMVSMQPSYFYEQQFVIVQDLQPMLQLQNLWSPPLSVTIGSSGSIRNGFRWNFWSNFLPEKSGASNFLMDLLPSGLLVEVLNWFEEKVVRQFFAGLLVKLLKRFSMRKKWCVNFLLDFWWNFCNNFRWEKSGAWISWWIYQLIEFWRNFWSDFLWANSHYLLHVVNQTKSFHILTFYASLLIKTKSEK